MGMMGGKNWKLLLENTKRTKKNMFKCFKGIISEECAESLVQFIYKQLKGKHSYKIGSESESVCSIEPMLPPLKLKRESIMCSTKTIFQDKLSQVLYEDFDKPYSEGNVDLSIKSAVSELREKESQFIAQVNALIVRMRTG